MNKKLMFALLTTFVALSAKADFNLDSNEKAVNCQGEDNQSWVLNRNRTAVKYTVEGESAGAQKITNRQSDGDTFVSYTTSEGVLTLSDQGDTYQFNGDKDAETISCK